MSSEGLPVNNVVEVDTELAPRNVQEAANVASTSQNADSAAVSADAAWKFSRTAATAADIAAMSKEEAAAYAAQSQAASETAYEDSREAIDKAIKESGFSPIDSFEAGATLELISSALRWIGNNSAFYSWRGGYPKVVPPGSTPETTGGFGDDAWVDVSDLTLRSEISSPAGAAVIGRCADIDQLYYQEPQRHGDKIDVMSFSASWSDSLLGTHAPGYFYYDATDTTSPANGGTVVVNKSGKRLKRIIDDVANTRMFGCYGDGVTDDSDSLQATIDAAVMSADYGVKSVVKVIGRVRITKTIYFDASKVSFSGPAEIAVDPTGIYKNNVAIWITQASTEGLASYKNKITPIFQGIYFTSFNADGNFSRTIDLFFAENKSGSSNDNASALHNVNFCQFSGFNKIFINGVGGWGWNWNGCGWNSCNRLLYLTNQDDTYERFSFFGCIWQNAGYAFEIDNPNGKIYWQGGSLDYCSGIGIITRGFVEINSHQEWQKRTLPLAELNTPNAQLLITGGYFAVRVNEQPYVMFNQTTRDQVTIRDSVVVSDGVNPKYAKLSNLPLITDNVTFTNDAAKVMALEMPASSIDADGMSTTTFIVSGTGLTETIQSDNSRLYTSTVGSGGSKGVDVLIPIVGSKQVGFQLVVSSAGVSDVYIKKLITNNSIVTGTSANATTGLIADYSLNGTTTIPGSSSHMLCTSGTLWRVGGSSFYLRIRLNADALKIGESLTIHSVKLVSC
ncbi:MULTISPECIES: hypothetical protein [unclassified Serratia (in: enterobacteria)]|uniref:tail fiber/spike domain-containing protein n=1 Tax=unclassified Serratia (in: enterobacteria) TaxID=2647522 RepID=UPI0004A7B333|nr:MULTISPECIES: hypothetical protein [unclassified Serratia (in: enterobacteria)]